MKKNRKGPSPGGDYDIGYKKPPQATRFKPGQSGNPKGRPRERPKLALPKRVEFLRIVAADAVREVSVREDGQPRTMPFIEALVRQLGSVALKNHKAAELYINYALEAEKVVKEQLTLDLGKLTTKEILTLRDIQLKALPSQSDADEN